ncbi:hypothetical protein VSWAT3_10531 [Vibrionales bacterium SWAT-3]|nr:hypothetical protein VSWAT3_10531 [Vibrionales bacterium SWAT-3]
MWLGKKDASKRDSSKRDAKSLKSRYKELDEGNGIRDTKSGKGCYEMRVIGMRG